MSSPSSSVDPGDYGDETQVRPQMVEKPPKKRSRKLFVFVGLVAIVGGLVYWVWTDPTRKATALAKLEEWGLKEYVDKIVAAIDKPRPDAPKVTTDDPGDPEPGPGAADPEPVETVASTNKVRAAEELARAEAYLETGNCDKALAAVERAGALDPGNDRIPGLRKRADRAITDAKERATKAAEAAQKAAIENARKRATAQASVDAARTLLEAKQYAQARKLVDKARAADPEFVEAMELLVEIQKAELVAARLEEQARLAQQSEEAKRLAAEKAKIAAAAAARAKAEVYLSTAQIMLEAGDPAKAVELSLKATELDPTNEGAKVLLAKAKTAIEDARKMMAAAKTAYDAKVKAEAAALAAGAALLAEGKFGEAAAKGKEALAIAPDSANARVFLAKVEAGKAKAERDADLAAATAAERAKAEAAEKRKVDTARKHLAVATVYFEKDELDRASAMTQKALELDPGSTGAVAMVGKIAERRKVVAAQVAASLSAERKLKAAEAARLKAERDKEVELALELTKRKEELEKMMAQAKAAEETRKKAAAEEARLAEAARIKAEEEARKKVETDAARKAEEDRKAGIANAAADKKAAQAAVIALDRALESENAGGFERLFAAESKTLARQERDNAAEFFALADRIKTAREVSSVEVDGDSAKVASRWTVNYTLKGQAVTASYISEVTLARQGGAWRILGVKNVRAK